jgi:hypothetical protein
MDTLKYMLANCPEPSEIVVPKDKKPKPWMFWHEIEDDGRSRRAYR